MPRPTAALSGPGWSRRSVLVLALALPAAGCTLSDPTVTGSGTSRTPTPTPTPSPAPTLPGSGTQASAEARLAALAAALGRRTSGVSGARRDLVSLVAQTHAERLAALASPDPASRPPAGAAGTSAPPRPTSPGRVSLGALADGERAAARRCRTAALATDGLPALLWGSMAVASSGFARGLTAGDPPDVARLRAHQPTAVVADTEALTAMVTSLHALVWGYQLALGRLRVGSTAADRATAGLTARRSLLARLSDRLRDVGAAVPAAAPAYRPSPQPTDARTAGRLVRGMETALLPFCGLWLAAASRSADRRLALDTLEDTAATAQSWGAPLTAWPGWRD